MSTTKSTKKKKQPAPAPVDLEALPADVESRRKTGIQARDIVDEIESDPTRRDELHRRIDAAVVSAIVDGISAFKAGKSKETAVAKLIDKSGLDNETQEYWRGRLEGVSFMLHEREGGILPCPDCGSFGPHLGDGAGLVTCEECQSEFDPDDAEMPVE